MSPKSKKVHASKSKSKSRTMKKGGGMFPFSWFDSPKPESKFDSVVPGQSSVQPTNDTSTSTSENKGSGSMFGNWTMTNPFSGVSGLLPTGWGSASQENRNKEFKQGEGKAEKSEPLNKAAELAAVVGGKKRSRKSRKSKKRVLKK